MNEPTTEKAGLMKEVFIN